MLGETLSVFKHRSLCSGADLRSDRCRLATELDTEDRLRLSQAETKMPTPRLNIRKGRDCWYKRDVETIKPALNILSALKLDPSYARPVCHGLADSYCSTRRGEGIRARTPKARLEAEKALSLDNRLAEAYTSRRSSASNSIGIGQTSSEIKQGHSIEINSADAHYWYAAYLSVMGRRDESIAESRRAAELDPLNPTYRLNIARMLYVARRDDDALIECKEAIRSNPNSGMAYVYLGYLYRNKGLYEQALDQFQHALTLTTDPWYIKSAIGTIYAMTGRKQEAKTILEELIAKARPIYVAQLQIALGEKDEAFASLEKAYQERADSFGFLNVDPSYDAIRSDPRFSDLVHRVGLPTQRLAIIIRTGKDSTFPSRVKADRFACGSDGSRI